RSVVIVDKEPGVAAHQSGHNSGVIHAGVYYRPGSDKARLCAAGRRAMVSYCVEHGIAHAVCGKLVVAPDHRQLAAWTTPEERSKANGLAVRRLGAAELRAREPHAAGIAALHVPETGIVDYGDVCQALAAEVQAAGAELLLRHAVDSITDTGTGSGLAVVA